MTGLSTATWCILLLASIAAAHSAEHLRGDAVWPRARHRAALRRAELPRRRILAQQKSQAGLMRSGAIQARMKETGSEVPNKGVAPTLMTASTQYAFFNVKANYADAMSICRRSALVAAGGSWHDVAVVLKLCIGDDTPDGCWLPSPPCAYVKNGLLAEGDCTTPRAVVCRDIAPAVTVTSTPTADAAAGQAASNPRSQATNSHGYQTLDYYYDEYEDLPIPANPTSTTNGDSATVTDNDAAAAAGTNSDATAVTEPATPGNSGQAAASRGSWEEYLLQSWEDYEADYQYWEDRYDYYQDYSRSGSFPKYSWAQDSATQAQPQSDSQSIEPINPWKDLHHAADTQQQDTTQSSSDPMAEDYLAKVHGGDLKDALSKDSSWDEYEYYGGMTHDEYERELKRLRAGEAAQGEQPTGQGSLLQVGPQQQGAGSGGDTAQLSDGASSGSSATSKQWPYGLEDYDNDYDYAYWEKYEHYTYVDEYDYREYYDYLYDLEMMRREALKREAMAAQAVAAEALLGKEGPAAESWYQQVAQMLGLAGQPQQVQTPPRTSGRLVTLLQHLPGVRTLFSRRLVAGVQPAVATENRDISREQQGLYAFVAGALKKVREVVVPPCEHAGVTGMFGCTHSSDARVDAEPQTQPQSRRLLQRA